MGDERLRCDGGSPTDRRLPGHRRSRPRSPVSAWLEGLGPQPEAAGDADTERAGPAVRAATPGKLAGWYGRDRLVHVEPRRQVRARPPVRPGRPPSPHRATQLTL